MLTSMERNNQFIQISNKHMGSAPVSSGKKNKADCLLMLRGNASIKLQYTKDTLRIWIGRALQ